MNYFPINNLGNNHSRTLDSSRGRRVRFIVLGDGMIDVREMIDGSYLLQFSTFYREDLIDNPKSKTFEIPLTEDGYKNFISQCDKLGTSFPDYTLEQFISSIRES